MKIETKLEAAGHSSSAGEATKNNDRKGRVLSIVPISHNPQGSPTESAKRLGWKKVPMGPPEETRNEHFEELIRRRRKKKETGSYV